MATDAFETQDQARKVFTVRVQYATADQSRTREITKQVKGAPNPVAAVRRALKLVSSALYVGRDELRIVSAHIEKND